MPKIQKQFEKSQQYQPQTVLRFGDCFYEGQTMDSRRHGYGILKDKSGQVVYQGFWEFDKFHGNGILYNTTPIANPLEKTICYQDLSQADQLWVKYDGIFKEGLRDGQGILYFCNQEKYLGQFFKDCVHGEGIYLKSNAQVIKGEWQYNKLMKQVV